VGLRQHLDRHVVRDQPIVDQAARKRVFGLRSGRKPNLNFLKADAYEQLKQLEFLLDRHRVHKGLIAVAQIDAAPIGRVVDVSIRPATLNGDAGPVRLVLAMVELGHGLVSVALY
jgi:hypothetical protein